MALAEQPPPPPPQGETPYSSSPNKKPEFELVALSGREQDHSNEMEWQCHDVSKDALVMCHKKEDKLTMDPATLVWQQQHVVVTTIPSYG